MRGVRNADTLTWVRNSPTNQHADGSWVRRDKDERKKNELSPAEQRRRFLETARELEVDDTPAGQERPFGKVGLKKPKPAKRPLSMGLLRIEAKLQTQATLRYLQTNLALTTLFTQTSRENVMVTLTEALAAERAKRQQHNSDTSTRQQIGRAVLEALADRLNAEPLPGWVFVLAGQQIHVLRIRAGGREQVATWAVDEKMRLVTGDQMTEWITAESYSRMIDEALQITAMLMVDAEAVAKPKSNIGAAAEGAEIVELPPRF